MAVMAAVAGSGAHDEPAGCNWQVCGRPEQRRGQPPDVCRGVAGVHSRPDVDSSDSRYSSCMNTELRGDNTKYGACCSPVAVRSSEGRHGRSGDEGNRPGTGCVYHSAGLPGGGSAHGAAGVGRNNHKKPQDTHSDPRKTLDKAHSKKFTRSCIITSLTTIFKPPGPLHPSPHSRPLTCLLLQLHPAWLP